MKALVLAAGRGERLRPLTDKIPKPLLEVGGRPLIHYPLLMLRAFGIMEVTINLHHLGEQIRESLGDGSSLSIAITYAPEPVLLGTGGPLWNLRAYFDNEPFIVLNSDTVINLDLNAAIELHRARGATATLVVRELHRPERYSALEVEERGMLKALRLLPVRKGGQPIVYEAPSGADCTKHSMMFCGISIFEPSIFAFPIPRPPFSLVTDLLGPALAAGAPIASYVHRDYFRTVDDLAAYEAVCREFTQAPPSLRYLE
jgi:NDP-sugar pyrophosphorylase family protein